MAKYGTRLSDIEATHKEKSVSKMIVKRDGEALAKKRPTKITRRP